MEVIFFKDTIQNTIKHKETTFLPQIRVCNSNTEVPYTIEVS